MTYFHRFSADFFKSESREFVVRSEMKKLWAVLLDMLLSFDEVCKRHGIKYFLDGGTLLGAVRHKGFIPWDDDMDVIMMREEYEKLCRIASDEFKSPLFFQTEYTDRASARRHAQLRRSDTTAILRNEMRDDKPVYTFNQGVFLDIFILDAAPDNPGELEAFRTLLTADRKRIDLMKWYMYGRLGKPFSFLHPGTVFFSILKAWYRFKKQVFGVDELLKVYRKFEADVTQYNGKGTRRVANFSFDPQRKDSLLFDRSIHENSALYEFEGYQFPGPADHETVLSGYYGNWHEHVIGGSAHGGVFFDLEKPYTEYLNQ